MIRGITRGADMRVAIPRAAVVNAVVLSILSALLYSGVKVAAVP